MSEINSTAANLVERRAARAAQLEVEEARLALHQRIASELLSADDSRLWERIASAQREVMRWETEQLCSGEFISRWREWLALPIPELTARMCSDAQGWGVAMRQNSPFLIQPESDPCLIQTPEG